MIYKNEFMYRLTKKQRQEIVQELLALDFLNTDKRIIEKILKRYKATMDQLKSLEAEREQEM